MRDWGASPEIIMTIEAMDKIDENSGCGMGQSWALMGKRTCRGLSTAGAERGALWLSESPNRQPYTHTHTHTHTLCT